MLVSLESIDHAYKQIKHNAQGNSVLIFVAPQCDALCACTILTVSSPSVLAFWRGGARCELLDSAQDLLQSDMIQYTLKPVSGESDIRKAVTELIENSDEVFFARHAASGKQSILAAAALVFCSRSCARLSS